MLIYNTTYSVSNDALQNFYIWLHEVFIPEVEREQMLTNPRLLKVLDAQNNENVSLSLQWEVSGSATLHRWYMKQGVQMDEQIAKMFGEKVVAFPTILEVLK